MFTSTYCASSSCPDCDSESEPDEVSLMVDLVNAEYVKSEVSSNHELAWGDRGAFWGTAFTPFHLVSKNECIVLFVAVAFLCHCSIFLCITHMSMPTPHILQTALFLPDHLPHLCRVMPLNFQFMFLFPGIKIRKETCVQTVN
jgi:hypothetical protein